MLFVNLMFATWKDALQGVDHGVQVQGPLGCLLVGPQQGKRNHQAFQAIRQLVTLLQ